MRFNPGDRVVAINTIGTFLEPERVYTVSEFKANEFGDWFVYLEGQERDGGWFPSRFEMVKRLCLFEET